MKHRSISGVLEDFGSCQDSLLSDVVLLSMQLPTSQGHVEFTPWEVVTPLHRPQAHTPGDTAPASGSASTQNADVECRSRAVTLGPDRDTHFPVEPAFASPPFFPALCLHDPRRDATIRLAAPLEH